MVTLIFILNKGIMLSSTKLRSRIGSFFMNGFNLVKSENLQWQQENHKKVHDLNSQSKHEKQALKASIDKQKAEFSFQLDHLKQQHETDLLMFKAECEQNINDYKQYLESIDQLKDMIQQRYSHLPDAISLTIHHHAKQILKQMWETKDFAKKMRLETSLLDLMTRVYQDTKDEIKQSQQDKQIPVRTLELIHLSGRALILVTM